MMDLSLSPFAQAVEKLSASTPIGSILKTAEWVLLPLELRESAFFSATIENAKWLEAAQAKILAAVSQARGPEGALMDRSVFIAEMRKLGTELGLRPTDPGKVDTLQDPLSTRRLRLIFDIQTSRAAGHAEWKMGNDADYLDAFPAQELVRKEERKAHRVWLKRWEAAGGGIYSGRMVALKTDDVWTRISRFGTPWPPFDFQSGMGLVELDRAEAEDLGLLSPEHVMEPQPLPFTENMQADVSSMSPRYVAGLKAIFGDQVAIADGKALWVGSPRPVMNSRAFKRDSIGRFAKDGGPLNEKDNIARGTRAVERALRTKADVTNAMHVNGLGAVHFPWGRPGHKAPIQEGRSKGKTHTDGYGISHALEKHGEKAVRALPVVIALGKVTAHPDSDAKRIVEHKSWRVVLLKVVKREAWLVTAYDPTV